MCRPCGTEVQKVAEAGERSQHSTFQRAQGCCSMCRPCSTQHEMMWQAARPSIHPDMLGLRAVLGADLSPISQPWVPAQCAQA
jgi:hypothetical protein